MNARRKIFLAVLAVAIAIAATAFPSSAAPEKIFRVDVSPTTTAAGGAQTFAVKYSNITPGNSSFTSVRLTVPSTFTITEPPVVSVTGTKPNLGKLISVNGQVVTVTNLDPVKNTQFVTISVATTVAGAGGGCSGSSVNWPDSSFEAWTGSQTVGNTFRLAEKSGTTTTVTASCDLRFVEGQNPGNASEGQPIPGVDGGNVQVELVSGNTPSSSLDGQTVTLSKVSGPTAVLSGETATLSGGVATFSTFSIDTAGTYTVKAAVGSLETAESPSFEIFGGVIDCGDPISFTGDQLDGNRGAFNKDGSTCVLVNYTVEDEVASRNEFAVSWDTGVQPTATFEYTVTWNPEAVDPSTGLPSERTQLAWTFDGSDPIWQYGVACTSTSLPAPYGTLDAGIDATETSISVTGGPTPATPFDFVIGTERLTATGITGSTWTVVRGVGGTTAAAHAAGDSVMSTPLPIDPNATRPDGSDAGTVDDPNPFQGQQIPMCIAEEGWVATGTAEVQVTSRIFDIGDGAGKRL